LLLAFTYWGREPEPQTSIEGFCMKLDQMGPTGKNLGNSRRSSRQGRKSQHNIISMHIKVATIKA
jgi:hypothetical protein